MAIRRSAFFPAGLGRPAGVSLRRRLRGGVLVSPLGKGLFHAGSAPFLFSPTALPMAVPRIRLSAIKPVPDQVIVPIVNTPAPEAALAVAPVAPMVEPTGESENPPATLPLFVMPAAPSGRVAPPADEPASEAVLKHSAAPALIKSSSVIFKWTVVAAILLGVAFVVIRFLVPFFTELKKPKSAVVVVDKEASFAVQALQQTRQVAAKNDAKVAYLNEVVATGETKPAEVKSVTPPPPSASPAFAQRAAAKLDFGPYQDVLARLKVESVVAGEAARAMIDGRLVRQGDIIERNLGLRFSGVDADEHVLLFTTAENIVFKKRY